MHSLEALADLLAADELDARVCRVTLDDVGDLQLDIEYDDFLMPNCKKRARLICRQAKEFTVTAGFFGSVDLVDQHILLANHQGPQGQLVFSSAPSSPAEVFFRAHQVLTAALQGWRSPADHLNGTPEQLRGHLLGGYGLLARGPLDIMLALAHAVEPLLAVNLLESHTMHSTDVALLLDQQFVICAAVEIVHDPS